MFYSRTKCGHFAEKTHEETIPEYIFRQRLPDTVGIVYTEAFSPENPSRYCMTEPAALHYSN